MALGESVAITGLGAVTSFGAGCDTLWHALLQKRSGAVMRSLACDVGVAIDVPIAAMPPAEGVPGVASELGFLAEQDCPGHRELAYALVACREALAQGGLSGAEARSDMGMVQAFEAPGTECVVTRLFSLVRTMADVNAAWPEAFSGVGGAASTSPQALPRRDGATAPPGVYDFLAPSFYRMQPFLYVHLAAKALGLHGYCTSVHNACSSGAVAIETAAERIRCGSARAMIVCGGEAFDTAVRLEWFRRLGMCAGGPAMTPFVDPPSGFFVGEGGAAMVLESESSAKRRGAAILARYRGGAFRHQAWKQVLPDVRGLWLREATREALRRVGESSGAIDLVVPHGAGTTLSDRYEAACLEQAAGGSLEGASAAAFKGNHGHLLAASGIIDTVAALLAMQHATVPPLVGGLPAAGAFPAAFVGAPIRRDIRMLLKLFTGFTGHDAALIFEAP